MNIDELKQAWTRQMHVSESEGICEEEIAFLIRKEVRNQVKIGRLLYNTSSFFFLLLFCQTC